MHTPQKDRPKHVSHNRFTHTEVAQSARTGKKRSQQTRRRPKLCVWKARGRQRSGLCESNIAIRHRCAYIYFWPVPLAMFFKPYACIHRARACVGRQRKTIHSLARVSVYCRGARHTTGEECTHTFMHIHTKEDAGIRGHAQNKSGADSPGKLKMERTTEAKHVAQNPIGMITLVMRSVLCAFRLGVQRRKTWWTLASKRVSMSI